MQTTTPPTGKRFYYFGHSRTGSSHKHNGIVTACVEYADETKSTIKVGLSFCSVKDGFVKKKGRMIAEGRMQKNPIMLPNSTGHSYDALHTYIASNLQILPNKIRKNFGKIFLESRTQK